MQRSRTTNFSAGATAASGTTWKPAFRTEMACSNPIKTLVPVGTASTTELPMLNTKKQTQSVKLSRKGPVLAYLTAKVAGRH